LLSIWYRGFDKEDYVTLKRPFAWTESARFANIVRRMRVKDITRPWRTNRLAAIGITAIGVLAAAILIGAHESRARRDTKPAAHTAATVAAEPAASASAPKPNAVTITGCLERDDQTFRLKDTEGADAPKSRSWKTGFLKKGSASIEIVDAPNRLKLTDHVGQRVSVTGTLVDREMRARSLQRIAPSCANSKPARSEAL
jgi:hypothetical protein